MDRNITNTTKRAPLSRIISVTIMTAMMFFVLASSSSSSLVLQQQAQATAYGLGDPRVPPAYIIVDGKVSRLQLENGDPSSGDATADYSRPAQGTISFGERFQLLVPQVPGIFREVQSAELTICGDENCATDDFHVRQELVNTRDTRFLYQQTYAINAPNGVGDGFTASDVGFKIFLLWTVSFTDGTEQTYLAIVHLKGDPCEEHGWDYSRSGTTCVDPNF
ncbi:MAG TPA: hypothetical protein VFR94_26650 [Nitrososphaeraceae archaeon]|nr:hypothetical protein [Nitrososphaeraceae archaeon]